MEALKRRPNDDAPLHEDPGDYDTLELAHCCRQVWASALIWYIRDARSGLLGQNGPCREALDDLTSADAPMLARLCAPLDLDPEQVRTGIIERVDRP